MKDWGQLFLCLLLSTSIWLIHNLSRSYVEVVSVPVSAESNLTGRARLSESNAYISAKVKATGFRLLRLGKKNRRAVKVFFDPSDFRHLGGDVYRIPSSSLMKYSADIFGSVEAVEAFVDEGADFSFPTADHKKVPVRQIVSLHYAEQYMAKGPMVFKPDSVTLYGELSRLENVDYILTKPIALDDVSTSVHGTVKLEIPAGIRSSHTEANYSLDVCRYVEISEEMRIQTEGVPAGRNLAVLPSTAVVTFRCAFPSTFNPGKMSRVYVDYKEFSNSLTGRCIVKMSKLPSGVLDYSIQPQVVDCVLVSN